MYTPSCSYWRVERCLTQLILRVRMATIVFGRKCILFSSKYQSRSKCVVETCGEACGHIRSTVRKLAGGSFAILRLCEHTRLYGPNEIPYTIICIHIKSNFSDNNKHHWKRGQPNIPADISYWIAGVTHIKEWQFISSWIVIISLMLKLTITSWLLKGSNLYFSLLFYAWTT